MKDTISAIKHFPVFGSGIEYFLYLSTINSTLTYFAFVNHAHNDYLELMLETGLIGFSIILWALYCFIKDNALYHLLGITKGINHERPITKRMKYFNYFGMKNVTNNNQFINQNLH